MAFNVMLPGNQQSYDPNFIGRVGGRDVTRLMKRWHLEDVEDGLSSITVTLANPDLKYAGVFRTEQVVVLQFGYHRGDVSPTITMKIKEKKEDFPTKQGPTIMVRGLDCTERLTGITGAGIANTQKLDEVMKSVAKGAGINLDQHVKAPEVPKDKRVLLPNMSSHSAIRYLMDKTECDEKGPKASNGEAPIKGQKEYDWGSAFNNGDVVTGDRIGAAFDEKLNEIRKNEIKNLRNRAGSINIVGRLELIGQPKLQGKKCLTIQNVGPEASGKWYIKRLVQDWDVMHGYRTICYLLRGTLGPDGKAIEQPVVMYAEIYKKDTVYIGCRKIDGENQGTFTYGTGENVMHFDWGIKLQHSRGAGEKIKMKGLAINDANQQQQPYETPSDGSYKSTPPLEISADAW